LRRRLAGFGTLDVHGDWRCVDWDGLLDRYVAQLGVRGLAEGTILSRRSELTRFGTWTKTSRPRVVLEEVNAERIVRYTKGRSAFHARATVSAVVSNLRCMGEFLVEEGVWKSNPLRRMRGPKIDPRGQVPRRFGKDDLKGLWRAAEKYREEHARHRTLFVLAILHGTGLRAGELERLTLAD
jgi:site-specific recombinase XerD